MPGRRAGSVCANPGPGAATAGAGSAGVHGGASAPWCATQPSRQQRACGQDGWSGAGAWGAAWLCEHTSPAHGGMSDCASDGRGANAIAATYSSHAQAQTVATHRRLAALKYVPVLKVPVPRLSPLDARALAGVSSRCPRLSGKNSPGPMLR